MKFWWRFAKRAFLMLLVLMATISFILYVFEDRIIKKVVAQANTYLKVPVKVEQINLHFWRTFPQLSVAFENVMVPDPLDSKDTLLRAEQISCASILLTFGQVNIILNKSIVSTEISSLKPIQKAMPITTFSKTLHQALAHSI